MAHYFPYDVKLGILADSRSFLANQKARNAIVGAENLLKIYIRLNRQLNDLLGICFLSDSTKISDSAERAEPAEPTLCQNLFTNPDFEAI